MRDIRVYLGKHFKNTTVKQLEQLLRQMNTMKDENGNTAVLNAKPSERRFIKFDAGFLELYVFCHESNLWSGTPKPVEGKSFKKRVGNTESSSDEDEEPLSFADGNQLWTIDGKSPLYADVLATVSCGQSRLKEYFQKYHRDGDLSTTSRSQAIVSLSKPKQNSDGLNTELMFATCLDVNTINKDRKVYITTRVKFESNRINEQLNDSDLDEVWPVAGSKGKKDLVECLVKARKKLKTHMGEEGLDWEESARADATERYEGTLENAKGIVENELEFEFFTFHGTEAYRDAIQNMAVTFKREPEQRPTSWNGSEYTEEFKGDLVATVLEWSAV